MARHNGQRVFVNENIEDIFNSVVQWETYYTKVPDQQDPKYTMVDIACNTDLVLMQRHMPEPLMDYLKRYDNHPQLNSTMATKYPALLKLDVNHFNKPPRVRVSLMPQTYSDVLEPKMQSISSRIADINRLKDLGWQVHINYSPVIMYHNFIQEYHDLFQEVKEVAGDSLCEVIFMTNHTNQMAKAEADAQEMMQFSNEVKNQSGVMRYPLPLKGKGIQMFKTEYQKFWNLDTIRYIF